MDELKRTLVRGQLYKTTVVTAYHASYRAKAVDRRAMLGDDILLRFTPPTNTQYITINTLLLPSLINQNNYSALLVVVHHAW